METLGVDMLTGAPTEVVILPKPTLMPLFTGLATGAVFLSLLAKLYPLAVVAAVVTVALMLAWTRTTGSRTDLSPLPIGRGASAPPHWQAEAPPSWWAMALALVADGVALSSLLFGALFLWLVAPGWPPPSPAEVSPLLLGAGALGALAAAACGRRAVRRLEAQGSPTGALVACLALHGVTTVLLLAAIGGIASPTTHAQPATIAAILAFAALHGAGGALLAGYALWRQRAGFLSPRRSLDLRIGRLWHDFSALAIPVCAASALLLALVAGRTP